MALVDQDTERIGLGRSKKRGILQTTANLEDIMVTRNLKNNSTGPEPFYEAGISKILEPGRKDSWLGEREEEVERVTNFIFSSKGLKWESNMAGLQTVQNGLEQKRFNNVSGRGGLKQLLTNVGKAIASDIGLTGATLEQVAGNGSGLHVEPYLHRAYLQSGNSSTLRQILAVAGLSRNGGVSGAERVRSGNNVAWEDTSYSLLGAIQAGDLSFEEGAHTHVKGERFEDLVDVTGSPVVPGGFSKYEDHLRNSSADDGVVKDSELMYLHSPSSYATLLEGADTQFTDPSNRDTYLKNTVRQRTKIANNYIDRNHSIEPNYWSTSNKYYPDGDEFKNEEYTYNKQIESNSGSFKSTTAAVVSKHSLFGESKSRFEYGDKAVFQTENINASRETLGKSAENFVLWHNEEGDEGYRINQIPFEISTITPTLRTYIDFEANLDSYTDNYTGNWDSVQYVGRAEQFYIYNGFTREVSFAFKVVSKNSNELMQLYSKLNALAAATAPTYETDLFMRGTLASVTIGDLLKSQVGIIKSVNLAWQQDYLWELDNNLLRVPFLLDCLVSFTPLHDFNVKSNIDLAIDGERYFGRRLKTGGSQTRSDKAGNFNLQDLGAINGKGATLPDKALSRVNLLPTIATNGSVDPVPVKGLSTWDKIKAEARDKIKAIVADTKDTVRDEIKKFPKGEIVQKIWNGESDLGGMERASDSQGTPRSRKTGVFGKIEKK